MADFRRKCDNLLTSAEATLNGRKYNYVDENAPAAYIPTWGAQSQLELQSGLRACMKEIVELRAELSAEKEAKSQLMILYTKRLREEMRIELGTKDHDNQRLVNELRAEFQQKFSEADASREADRRRWEEAVRHVKVHERQQFDVAEEFREGLDEMRGRIDAAVNSCYSAKSEVARELEKERTTMQHRLDVELLRYGELHRSQQQQLEVAKSQLSREVTEVSKVVRSMVEEVWSERMRSMTRHVDDSIKLFNDKTEQNSAVLSDLQLQFQDHTTKIKQELNIVTSGLRERIVEIENSFPLLVSRVDRYEKRGDALVDSNGRLSSQIDVMKEISDKAASQSARATDRVQRIEEMLSERDHRITSLEAQTVALAGVDKWRAELETTKRSVARVEHAIDGIKQIAENDERRVDSIQRHVDTVLERVEGSEKKASKVIAKIDATEKRFLTFVDRVATLEDSTERVTATLERIESSATQTAAKSETLESRVSTQTDRLDHIAREFRDRIERNESTFEEIQEVARTVDATSTIVKHDIEKIVKRVAKAEAIATNASENLKDVKESSDTLERELVVVKQRLEAAREAAERRATRIEAQMQDTGDVRLVQQLEQHCARLEKRLQSDIDRVRDESSTHLDNLQSRVSLMHQEVNKKQLQQPRPVLEPQTVSLEVMRPLEDGLTALQSRMATCESTLRTLERTFRNTSNETESKLDQLTFDIERIRSNDRSGLAKERAPDPETTTIQPNPNPTKHTDSKRLNSDEGSFSFRASSVDDTFRQVKSQKPESDWDDSSETSPDHLRSEPPKSVDDRAKTELPPKSGSPSVPPSKPPVVGWREIKANPFHGTSDSGSVADETPPRPRPQAKAVRATGYVSSPGDSSSPEHIEPIKPTSSNPFRDESTSESETVAVIEKKTVNPFASRMSDPDGTTTDDGLGIERRVPPKQFIGSGAETSPSGPEEDTSPVQKNFHVATKAARERTFDADTSSDDAAKKSAGRSSRGSKATAGPVSAKSKESHQTDLSEMDLTLSGNTPAHQTDGRSSGRAQGKPAVRQMFASVNDFDADEDEEGAEPLNDEELLKFGN